LADDERDKRAQYAYLDLLATTLTEHEKTLGKLIERLERLSKNLAKVEQPLELGEEAKSETTIVKKEVPETLTYIKMKLNRSTEELKEILKALKE